MDALQTYLHCSNRRAPAILVGPNGAGKSRFLVSLGKIAISSGEHVFAISNTVFDRLKDIRGAKRISSNKGERLPSNLLKEALRNALETKDGFSTFRQIGRTLEYCGYSPTIGLKVRSTLTGWPHDLDERMEEQAYTPEVARQIRDIIEIYTSRAPPEMHWIYFEGRSINMSRFFDYAGIITWEKQLKALGIITSIEIVLSKDGEEIPISKASSGQLSLISTFVFLSTIGKYKEFWILIDEPENSLHPQWQKEYINRLRDILGYREAAIVIATHAPVLVSGAKLDERFVDVFRISDGTADLILEDNSQSAKPGKQSVEQILWEAFDTVTPANHFISSRLVSELQKVERGEESASQVEGLIVDMKEGAYDDEQREFLSAVADLARRVENKRGQFKSYLDDDN